MRVKWVDVADAQAIEKGKMILVEVERIRAVVANVDGEFYAFNDRSPHMDAPLHLGTLHGKVVRCALHFSSYDITTGKKLSDPTELSTESSMPPEILQKLPPNLIQTERGTAEIRRQIETLDLETYETKTKNNRIFARI
jgi:nitrite reductase/ring-hydroxylating ferredoxin subunit